MASQQPSQAPKPIAAPAPHPSVGGPQAKVTNPHGPIATPCQNCHSYTSWKPIRSNPEFSHDQTGYPLRGMHEKVGCTKCHSSLVFKNVSKTCADCHADIHRRQFGANCESCHTVKGWKVSLDAIKNHQNRFPLVGAHALVECEACHKSAAAGQFAGLSTACYSCHQQDYKTPVLDHVSANLPTTCETCHSMNSWLGARFDHLKFANYALTGMHATLPCTACHLNNRYKGTPADCFSCHTTEFTTTNNPPHVQLALPHDCGTCHSTTNWLNATFDHALFAHYPLTGGHANVTCAQCHLNNSYSATSTACYSCHQPDFTRTTAPNHVTAGFPTDCSLCHTITVWTTTTFNHATVFPLVGFHATLACAQCHINNNYTTVPKDCYSCHTTDFNGTNSPPHLSANLPHTCDTCHSQTNWLNATFDHAVYANYPLTGGHATLTCVQCHANNAYTATPTACYSCHQTDYNGTTNPAHLAAGFPTDCTLCHTTASWTTSSFNHATVFPLIGFHATLACAQCHINNNYTSIPKDCYSCHITDFTGTNNPPHVAGNLPHTCDSCHSQTNWLNATFDHAVYANYPLTGGHASVTCAQCHLNNSYTATPTACYSCHQTDYNGTTNPAHLAAGFPTDCTLCHTVTVWTTSTFNHATVFALTGFHATMPCAQCHVNNNYTTLPKDCYSCHTTDFNGTNSPPHVSANLPHTCDTCHSTTNWLNASFDHGVYANYPLTGFHATVTCAQCHANNNYTATPTACYSCHQADFTGTTNPNHVTSGFPTDCSICHSTTNWTSSTFNHATTAFPLTGFHLTMPCAQCHVNNNYTTLPTLCYGCHTTDWNGTTNPAHAAAGFPTTCDTCHTTTDWTGATFNHASTPFPLTGAHTTVACNLCHINNVFVGTPTDCYSCHTKDFTGTTNPNHVTAAWPTTCATCHTTTAWLPATLPASYHTFFPMTHGNANSVCATCHTNTSDYSVFTCTATCHGSGNSANFKHPSTNGYVYNSVNCYACHKSGGGG